MHYHAEIWIAEKEDFEAQVKNILVPFEKRYIDENLEGFWDWYQIGGRWTGIHTGYDPYEDERNLEICRICNGTGFRMDGLGQKHRETDPTYSCNGCGEYDKEMKLWRQGNGKSVKWPTNFAFYEGDVISVSEVENDLECYMLIVGDKIFQDKVWNGKNFVDTDSNGNVMETLRGLDINSGYLVTVDYHF